MSTAEPVPAPRFGRHLTSLGRDRDTADEPELP
jgi:hypothetical protein